MKVVLRDQHAPVRSAKRLGIFLLLPLVVLVITVFFFARQWRNGLVIEKVVVEGAKILAARDVVNMAAIQPPAFMYSADLFGAQQRLLAQPFVKSATVIRMLPHTLKIQVVEREPIASVAGGSMPYVDSECVLIPRLTGNRQFDLPLISGISGLDSAAFGAPVGDTDLIQAIDVLKAGQNTGFYHAISEVHMTPGSDIVMYAAEGGVPVILGRGGIPKKMLTLQTFWTGFMKPDTLAILQYIDARFDGQIVVKRMPQKGGKPALPPHPTL